MAGLSSSPGLSMSPRPAIGLLFHISSSLLICDNLMCLALSFSCSPMAEPHQHIACKLHQAPMTM